MNLYFYVFIIFYIYFSKNIVDSHYYRNELIHFERRNTIEMVESRGFFCHPHHVTTSDGYILTVFRIINPRLWKATKPVLLQHGFTGNSNMFVISSSRNGYLWANGTYYEDNNHIATDCLNFSRAGRTVAFVLAACGYDVWLGNTRGNSYSKNHTTLDYKDTKFWEFTIDELSLIDVPAVIDYILNYTKKDQLGYIGLSMGTTNMFALLSANPKYSQKVRPFIALAPVAFVNNVENVFTKFKFAGSILRNFPMPLIHFPFVKKLAIEIMGADKWHPIANRLNETLLVELSSNVFVDESSTWVMSHLFQLMENQNFAKYDYGITENLRRYGVWRPPDYPIANIDSKHIAFIRGMNDSIANNDDVMLLKNNLKVKLLADYVIPDPSWNHVDFIFNEKCGNYINTKVLQLLSIYKQ